MNNNGQSNSYEATPCRLVADGVPLLAQEEDLTNPKEVLVRGIETLPTSIEDAQARVNGRLQEVERRLKRGDHQGLVDILDDHPRLIAHPWVRAELIKWLATGRSYRKRGRRRRTFFRCALVIAGIVEELIRRGLAANKEQAFHWLADHWQMSYDSAKFQCYQAWKDERFKPILFEIASSQRVQTSEEITQVLSSAKMVKSGTSVTRTLAEFQEGPLTLTIEGL